MKHIGVMGVWAFLTMRVFANVDEALDRWGDTLTFNTTTPPFSLKASGTLDLEGYELSQPSFDPIFTEGHALFVPRLSLFLDAQLGPRVYVFAQMRLDRGFDPSDESSDVRIDEYALRAAITKDSHIVVQVGKFSTVLGNWVKRHASWDNPFITPPLAYGHLTGIWDIAAPFSTDTLLRWSHVQNGSAPNAGEADKYFRLPIVWGPAYGSGAALFVQTGPFDLAAEIKNTALSARPDNWSPEQTGWEHPSFTGRIGFQPNPMWNLGLSASSGAYLAPTALPSLHPGYGLAAYREIVLAHDISFAWHHWRLWAEVLATRFTIPGVADPKVLSWYLETKYKFAPQFSGAIRFGQQLYGRITDSTGRQVRWGRNTWSLDIAPTYRLAAHLQLKAQYSLQHEDDAPATWGHVFATQITLRF